MSSKGGKGWAVRFPIGLAVIFGVLAMALSQTGSSSSTNDQAQPQDTSAAGASATHQLEGLSHPLDSKKSTAALHSQMLLSGFEQGFTSPLGHGLSSITIGAKLSGQKGSSTEVDVSDSFVSMGAIGGLLYVTAILLILRRVIVFGRNAPKYIGLPILGILASMLGAWIPQGQYGIGPLIWIIIGGLSRYGSSPGGVPTSRSAVAMPLREHITTTR